MKIYVAHSRAFDFVADLYKPIRESALNSQYEFVLPHESSDEPFASKGFLKDEAYAMVVEGSFPSTGLGIELGWADVYNVPIICFYKQGTKPSGSLFAVTDRVIEYRDQTELIQEMEKQLAIIKRA
ncbi:hypothetical protein COV06_04490 [Candidatus Uhrbacteria bacterium CG10_big_fil_rev_8_21_14_0_10_50_16]|uniref:Nucleoside 2-deoxyribosyltransferase n=1 Tax=Candidatus Uhrbacteria bacterium CG10_big_fil_rev_8_21_14_0_10_50_16 TaxID=1975039 RepID=A0A2H0RL80_9BACT|nr:MAG: hypothetical protein COV06_04490 [Candidatus Uhrbacteria bacterium CG10_big_fil_rev_8_21_14_0_10_50_16]